MPALRHGVAEAHARGAQLVVVHAGSVPIAVQDGPTAAIANSLGNPPWALVHSTVHGLAVPDDTQTTVEPGDPVSVIGRIARPGDLVVVGGRQRSRWRSTAARLRLSLPCPVIVVSDDEMGRSVVPVMSEDRSVPA